MSTPLTHPGIRLGRLLELLAIAGMALVALHILLIVTGPNVGDVRPSATNIAGVDRVMSVRGELVFPVDFGDRLAWTDTAGGTRDAATGLEPVELGGPVEAELSFWNPTRSQRASWAAAETFGPLLALAGIWTVYGLVHSTRVGDPFTTENEHRLWLLAGIVAIGGTLDGLVTGVVDTLLIEHSAAADLVRASSELSAFPIAVGLLLAMLALVWRIGIRMREDLEGTI